MNKLFQITFLVLISVAFIEKINAQLKLSPQKINSIDFLTSNNIENKESLLKYFIDNAHSITFKLNNTSKKQEINIDSLLEDFLPASINLLNYGQQNSDTTFYSDIVLRRIYLNLKWISKKSYPLRNQKELENIYKNILQLSNSNHKIWLLLYYARLKINPKYSFNEASEIGLTVSTFAELIKDKTEKGLANSNIGFFYAQYKMNTEAIRYFYFAIEDFSKSKKQSLRTYDILGSIYSELSRIFLHYTYSDPTFKGIDYLQKSKENYRLAGDQTKFSLVNAKQNSIYIWYYYVIGKYSFEITPLLKELKRDNEKILQNQFIRNNFSKYLNNFWNGLALGHFLSGEGYYKEALVYYTLALNCSIENQGYFTQSDIDNAIYNVSWTYNNLGNLKLASKYCDFAISVAQKTNNSFLFYKNLIRKTKYLQLFNNYDSALITINSIINDTTMFQKFSQSESFELYQDAINSREKIYRATKKDNLAVLDKDTSSVNSNYSNQEYASIIQQEGYSINQLEYINFLEDRNILTSQVNALYSVKDSLQNILLLQKDSSTFFTKKVLEAKNQSLFQQNKNKELSQNNQNLKNKNIYLILSLFILAIIIIVSINYVRIQNKKEIELDFIIKQKILSGHDFKELINTIPRKFENSISKIKIENTIPILKAVEHSINVAVFINSVVENDKATQSIDEELKHSDLNIKIYMATKKSQEYSTILISNITDLTILNDIKVPAYLFNNFIKNSMEHGFDAFDKKDLTITVSSIKIKNGYQVFIEDDGCGINYSKINNPTSKESKGLSHSKEAIQKFNKTKNHYKISFSIHDKSEQMQGNGTLVILTFIKKMKWKFL